MWPLPIVAGLVALLVAGALRTVIVRKTGPAGTLLVAAILPLIGGVLYAFIAYAILVLVPPVFQGTRVFSFYSSPVAWIVSAASAAVNFLLQGFYLALPLGLASQLLLRRTSH
jgi:hypothetical protein